MRLFMEVSMFKVGENVVLVGEGTKDYLLEIDSHMYTPNMHRVKILATGQFGPVFKKDIRLATEEEIAAGHRIDTETLDHPENHISQNCKVIDHEK